ncbi:hypothetical protein pb186bvf_019541 [Paramecium bursaria]
MIFVVKIILIIIALSDQLLYSNNKKLLKIISLKVTIVFHYNRSNWIKSIRTDQDYLIFKIDQVIERKPGKLNYINESQYKQYFNPFNYEIIFNDNPDKYHELQLTIKIY